MPSIKSVTPHQDIHDSDEHLLKLASESMCGNAKRFLDSNTDFMCFLEDIVCHVLSERPTDVLSSVQRFVSLYPTRR